MYIKIIFAIYIDYKNYTSCNIIVYCLSFNWNSYKNFQMIDNSLFE